MAGFVATKGNGAKIPYKKYMQSRPVRNDKVDWEKLNSDVIKLYLPYKKTAMMKLLGRFIDIPDERSFRFNPMGSMVWELCDGNNTVEEIKEIILKRTKSSDKDVEKRLSKFINRLIRNELITLDTS
ncbi:PqqD family protein [Methanocella sp. MCL-LM]|uniref:PqqD family protein n=1 Tax=Methanocella sp. MCL-LM TaxID=3412035 RepID=UPI003C730BE6